MEQQLRPLAYDLGFQRNHECTPDFNLILKFCWGQTALWKPLRAHFPSQSDGSVYDASC